MGLLLKERICSSEQILSFKTNPHFDRAIVIQRSKKKVIKVVSICQVGEKNLDVYPYTLSEDDKIQICIRNVFATTIKMSV